MNETKAKAGFTPGPWFVDMDPIDTATDIRAKWGWNGVERIPSQMLAQMVGKRDETRDANARLIAASPTLFEFIAKLAKAGNIEAKQTLDSLQLGY